jgi:hypothetical protein
MTLLLGAEELTKRLQSAICPVCTERREDGSCGLERISECPITTHLDGLVYTAATVKSGRMDRYVDAVRRNICPNCAHRLDPAERCDVRLEGHCALDSYLMPALDVIDDFIAEVETRAKVGPKSQPAA